MHVTLTIIRYPKRYTYFALLAMAVHRLPFSLNKNLSFYKLMGSGKNGTFDKHPDWQQWAVLAVHKKPVSLQEPGEPGHIASLYGAFIHNWFTRFKCETYTMLLEPIEGHGYWDKTEPFGKLPKHSPHEGVIGVMTRATIRMSKMRAFWNNVPAVAGKMNNTKGLYTSFGIGEIPFLKQATFSVWESKEAMKDFAYRMKEHNDVIQKTRKENWYSEELFVRFKLLLTIGTIHGHDPLEGKF